MSDGAMTLGAVAALVGADMTPFDAAVDAALPKAAAAGSAAADAFVKGFNGTRTRDERGRFASTGVSTREGIDAGESFGKGFSGGFSGSVGDSLGKFRMAVRDTQEAVQLVSAVSGVGIAARYERLEQGFKGITGSAKEARDIMRQRRIRVAGEKRQGVDRAVAAHR